jgi:hypothetical protein
MFRYPHYHAPQDTVDKIDFERLARVVRGLGKAIRVLASSDGGLSPAIGAEGPAVDGHAPQEPQ